MCPMYAMIKLLLLSAYQLPPLYHLLQLHRLSPLINTVTALLSSLELVNKSLCTCCVSTLNQLLRHMSYNVPEKIMQWLVLIVIVIAFSCNCSPQNVCSIPKHMIENILFLAQTTVY